jgi:hypothetical protein
VSPAWADVALLIDALVEIADLKDFNPTSLANLKCTHGIRDRRV